MEIRYNSDTDLCIIFADPRIKGDTNEKIKRMCLSAYSRPAFWRNMGDDGCGKDTWPSGPSHRFRECAIVMEVNTGTVLDGKKEHQKCYPASITVDSDHSCWLWKNSSLDETVTFSEDSIYNTEGSPAWPGISGNSSV